MFNLPQTLTHLTFGYCFNKIFDLLSSTKYLKLDCNNQYIINNLPNSLEELELNYSFNLELNNLPTSIHKIIFHKNSVFDKELNCLPNFVKFLQLPKSYNKKILNLPKELKEIVCLEDYKYVSDFTGYNVMYY